MRDDTVLRLHRCLVDELRRRGHEEDQPVRVSEIHRELIPYRVVRPALGVELNADYEHALLRLLAGERDMVRLEPVEARQALQQEARSPYPSVGLFRKFDDHEAWVSMRSSDASSSGSDASRGDVDPGLSPDPVLPHVKPRAAAAGRAGEETKGGAGACPFCGEGLPDDREVRFCPYCGGDQTSRRCPECEAVVEEDWRFCIRCGHDVAAS